MLMRVFKTRWLVMPFAILIIFFSAGAAVAPECHVQSSVQSLDKAALVHNHSGVLHSHNPQSEKLGVVFSLEKSSPESNVLNKEICLIAGFIVLLLLRFSSTLRSPTLIIRLPQVTNALPIFQSKYLGYLNLTHLKLGIIRI